MMENFKNFKGYSPEGEDKKALASSLGAIFLISDEGKDWYDSQASFQPETMKVVYESNGVIRSLSQDVSTLYPEGASVTEVLEWPEEARGNEQWCLMDGQIVPRVYTMDERQEQAHYKRRQLLEKASKSIAPLADAVELGVATEQEVQALKNWKAYRVALHRLEPKAGEIT